MKVWLIKPSIDTRDGESIVKSRIGLFAPCYSIDKSDDLFYLFENEHSDADVIIADECQFFTEEQIDQLRKIVDEREIPVLCFGLRTDFLCHLFPGSKRLFEIADSISEIKTICACGRKAIVNARMNNEG
jgi:thymidine kinase